MSLTYEFGWFISHFVDAFIVFYDVESSIYVPPKIIHVIEHIYKLQKNIIFWKRVIMNNAVFSVIAISYVKKNCQTMHIAPNHHDLAKIETHPRVYTSNMCFTVPSKRNDYMHSFII